VFISGDYLPENVGIPLDERGGVSYFMLEVHYDNKALHEGENYNDVQLRRRFQLWKFRGRVPTAFGRFNSYYLKFILHLLGVDERL
jgi:hypothetical protein